MIYPINNIYPCIQGEGCLSGTPMVMLRLHGCAVGCPWCDTKETWEMEAANVRASIDDVLGANSLYVKKGPSEINHYIKTNFPFFRWVLISGGEPAQYRLRPLINALHDGGFKVAIETSGTEIGHLEAGLDWICVSPKIDMPGGKKVKLDTFTTADEIKYVVGKRGDIDKLDEILSQVQLKEGCQICLQPVSQSPKATALCMDIVMDRNYRLSVQMHKYLDIP